MKSETMPESYRKRERKTAAITI